MQTELVVNDIVKNFASGKNSKFLVWWYGDAPGDDAVEGLSTLRKILLSPTRAKGLRKDARSGHKSHKDRKCDSQSAWKLVWNDAKLPSQTATTDILNDVKLALRMWGKHFCNDDRPTLQKCNCFVQNDIKLRSLSFIVVHNDIRSSIRKAPTIVSFDIRLCCSTNTRP